MTIGQTLGRSEIESEQMRLMPRHPALNIPTPLRVTA